MNEKIQALRNVLSQLIEPKLKWKVGDLNLIQKIEMEEEGKVTIVINLITDDEQEKNLFRNQVFQALTVFQFQEIDLRLEKINVAKQGIQGIKNIILVSSGKGGVGKSTIAVSLASILSKRGHRVGLMDADIYGPSVPQLLGIDEKPQVLDDEVLMPIEKYGIKSISLGMLIPPERAVTWRAQLVSGTILQFIRKVYWTDLDYLIIDMPPGTGDIQLTLAHELKVKGVILISMPQEVVIGDVRRSVSMYREKEIPILGLIQNMVSYHCESCGKEQQIFPGTTNDFGGIPQLAALPLDPALCQSGNEGIPYVLQNEDSPFYREFEKVAEALEEKTQS